MHTTFFPVERCDVGQQVWPLCPRGWIDTRMKRSTSEQTTSWIFNMHSVSQYCHLRELTMHVQRSGWDVSQCTGRASINMQEGLVDVWKQQEGKRGKERERENGYYFYGHDLFKQDEILLLKNMTNVIIYKYKRFSGCSSVKHWDSTNKSKL